MSLYYRLFIAVLSLFSTTMLFAQTGQPKTTTGTAVPRLIRVNSTFRPANGSAASAIETAVLTIYAMETGGAPLWQETQSVTVDNDGHYSLLLGSARNEGLPVDLFASGEPRWLGVQFQRPGEVEQPRVLLASVPYALKAADAETLGGQPLSSFVLANPATASNAATSTSTSLLSKPPLPRISSGTPGYIGQFVNTTDLVNSVMFQNGTKIGLGTTSPVDYMHIAFNDSTGMFTGYAVQNLNSGPAAYSGMLFYDQSGALGQFQGFNNSSHEYRINNIAQTGGSFDGSINFMIASDSKFLVRSNGDIEIPGSIRKGGTLFLHNLGTSNTAVGLASLALNSGPNNTAVGFAALGSNTSGTLNAANGDRALEFNTDGGYNTASGSAALQANTHGGGNTASGICAVCSNTTGSNNTGIGVNALFSNTTGSLNTAVGAFAGKNLTTGDYNVVIANDGFAGDAATIRIGMSGHQNRAFITGIRGVGTGNNDAIPVFIDSAGQLGTASSSRRFKTKIQDMGDASENLLKLRPVTFYYKQQPNDRLEYGLIAEEVADIYPDLVVSNKDGQIETVQYQKLTPMLLNELQKQHRQNVQQDETIRQQADRIQSLESRLSELEARLSRKTKRIAAGK